MFDADTGCIATDPETTSRRLRRRFRSPTGIENLPANEHVVKKLPHTPSPTRTTRRIQHQGARVVDIAFGMGCRVRSQHIDIDELSKWIPVYSSNYP